MYEMTKGERGENIIMLDLYPKLAVGVALDQSRGVLWVTVDGITRLRARIPNARIVKEGMFNFAMTRNTEENDAK